MSRFFCKLISASIFAFATLSFSQVFASVNCNGNVMVYCGIQQSYSYYPGTANALTFQGCGCYSPSGNSNDCVSSTDENGNNPDQGQCCEDFPDGTNCLGGEPECFNSGCANWCSQNKCTNTTPEA